MAIPVLLLLLCACAASQTKRLTYAPPATLPASAVLKNVPFFPQQAYYCGPASLAMAMNFHGLRVTQEALARAVYVPELKGALQAEMLAATRRHGLLAYVLTPKLRTMLEEIAAGHPVVVLQNLGVSWYPVWHYAVAIGYDLRTEKIVLHSGINPRYQLSLATFERTWARSDYWALAPLPPDQLPRDNRPRRALKAAAALEETGQTLAARQTYAAAARRWPKNLIARMGLGNTLYALGDKRAAMRTFTAAIRIDSEAAAAWNNLAVALDDLGCNSAARAAARHAVGLDEARKTYRETLEQIEARPMDANAPPECPPVMAMTEG